jgi:hypothetical protein
MIENISTVNKIEIAAGRKKPSYNDDQRKKYCKGYADSGLSVQEYCKLSKISQSALRRWLHKYSAKTFFMPVSPQTLSNHYTKQTFEIIFPNGIRLRFPELIDCAVIKQLIKEVGACT